MIIKEIFGARTFVNGFDPANAYTQKLEGGISITVNAGNWRDSMDAAHLMASAFYAGNNAELGRIADSQMGKARGAQRGFEAVVSQEIKLLPPPALDTV